MSCFSNNVENFSSQEIKVAAPQDGGPELLFYILVYCILNFSKQTLKMDSYLNPK